MQRPVLLHIEPTSSAVALGDRCRHALAAGFDGFELPAESLDDLETIAADLHIATTQSCQQATPAQCGPRCPTAIAVTVRCSTCKVDDALEEVTRFLTRASAAGASCLSLSIPPLLQRGDCVGFGSYQEAINFTSELLRQLRFGAEAAGVALALEGGADGCLVSPVELRELINAANSWAVGVCIDVNRIARISAPTDWLATLSHRVQAVRVNLADLADRAAPATPDNVVDPRAILETLDKIRYHGPLIATGLAEPAQLRASLS